MVSSPAPFGFPFGVSGSLLSGLISFFFFFFTIGFFWGNLGFRSPPGLLGWKKKATPTQCLGLKGVGNEVYNDRCFPPPVSNERRGFLMEAFQHLFFLSLFSNPPRFALEVNQGRANEFFTSRVQYRFIGGEKKSSSIIFQKSKCFNGILRRAKQ